MHVGRPSYPWASQLASQTWAFGAPTEVSCTTLRDCLHQQAMQNHEQPNSCRRGCNVDTCFKSPTWERGLLILATAPSHQCNIHFVCQMALEELPGVQLPVQFYSKGIPLIYWQTHPWRNPRHCSQDVQLAARSCSQVRGRCQHTSYTADPQELAQFLLPDKDHHVTNAISRPRATLLLIPFQLNFTFGVDTVTAICREHRA